MIHEESNLIDLEGSCNPPSYEESIVRPKIKKVCRHSKNNLVILSAYLISVGKWFHKKKIISFRVDQL